MRLETLLGGLETLMRLRGITRHEWADGDLRMSYQEYGKHRGGRTLVLVHGLGTSTLSWVKVFGALGKRHHVLAVDLPAWGHSPAPGGRDFSTIPEMTDAVIRFLEGVAKRPVTLVGQSMGGWVCAKVAAARPDLVEELILCNNAGVLYPEIDELRRRLDLQTPEAVREFWGLMWHRVPGFYRFFTANYVDRMHEPRVLRFFDTLTEGDFINADLPRLAMPVSIIWGASDRFIPAHTVDRMLPLLSNARVYWVPECGHIVALEKPREFVRLLDAIVPPKKADAT